MKKKRFCCHEGRSMLVQSGLVIILFLATFVAQAHAKDLAQISVDRLADKVVEKLVNRAFKLVHYAALGNTTLGKSHPRSTALGKVQVERLTSEDLGNATMLKKKDKDAKKAEKQAKMEGELEKMSLKDSIKSDGPKKLPVLEAATVTGVWTAASHSLDVKLDQVSVMIAGKEFVKEVKLELNFGHRYGLIGQNGAGKSTILAALSAREVPIPDHIDIWHLHEEAKPSDQDAIKSVTEFVQKEYERLEELQLKLMEDDAELNADLIDSISERLDKMDPSTFESRACELLHGLGFTLEMMKKATKDMSGGWRMRVALAQALFIQPHLLLLDEPTNHLDLGACVWLEEYLSSYPSILVLISHSQDFLNGVCTDILQLTPSGKINSWSGDYDSYVKARIDLEKNQMTKYKKEQDNIKEMQDFIRSCGTYANLRKQAECRQKIIDKMVAAGLTEKPEEDPTFSFRFPDSEKLPPPVLAFDEVGFAYNGKKDSLLYQNVNLAVDTDSRVALVGPNGAGKSTLLKLMLGELTPTEGDIKRHGKLRFGRYNQHSEEVLDLEASPLEFVMNKYSDGVNTPQGLKKLEMPEWRSKLGIYGIRGEYQTRPMKTMSDGLKTRVVMLLISLSNPHILLLDEPTNHLDMGMIDALADAINKFAGGLVLVSHDFRLIGQVAQEIWLCDKKSITKWNGDIKSYKKQLRSQVISNK
eukprot:gnl/MRDRNA2_/MRDRNA2_77209_c0_seq1.p1 gnl/MRDRNA2_/MRDRNA2_77209_c0~~gnl/MRDRNA2_/MRDRNA2_77209_c0_seq1.p1  ORF type:complete len:700 (-),score=152.27 gnl/MRDRNA2_/MRDRNA2_77209_c0_seq1:22-2121(-)